MNEIAEINGKLDAIMKALGISGNVRRSKKDIESEMTSRVNAVLNKRRKRAYDREHGNQANRSQ